MKITLRTILLWAAGLLAIVAFFLTFGAGIINKGDNITIERVGLVFGDLKMITTTTLLGKTNVVESSVELGYDVHSLLSQIGAFMVLGGGVLAALLGLSKSKNVKGLAVFLALVIAAGSVFVLLVQLGYQEAVIKNLTKDMTNETIIDITRNAVEDNLENYKNNTMTIVSTILGFASAALAAISGFVKTKKRK